MRFLVLGVVNWSCTLYHENLVYPSWNCFLPNCLFYLHYCERKAFRCRYYLKEYSSGINGNKQDLITKAQILPLEKKNSFILQLLLHDSHAIFYNVWLRIGLWRSQKFRSKFKPNREHDHSLKWILSLVHMNTSNFRGFCPSWNVYFKVCNGTLLFNDYSGWNTTYCAIPKYWP